MNKYFIQHSIVLLAITLIFGCAKKSDDDDSSSSASGSSAELVSAMPSNLAISSNTASGSSVASRVAIRSTKEIKDDSDPVRHKDKVDRIKAVLKAESIDQCHKAIPKNMKHSGGKYVSCYGPELAYVNHPSDNTSDGTLPTGDLGIWTPYSDNSTQEACAAGQMNLLMKKTSKKLDLAMGISAMMVCAAKNDGLSKPSVGGGALDVTESVKKTKISDKRGGMSITSATLQRSSLASGKTLWTSSLSGSFKATGDSSAQSFTITLKHVPSSEGSSVSQEGEGLVQMYQEGLSETDGNCGGSTLGIANSVAYKTTSDNLSFRAIRAKFPSSVSGTGFFDTDGELIQKNSNEDSTNGWCADYNVVVANVDSDGFGKVSYAWQAGKGDGYTRTFNIKTDNVSGTLSGDAYFGFNPNPDTNNSNDYRSTSIDRMICNWAGPNNGRTGVSKIQRQQLSYDSTNYVWKSTSDNITFAPTNSCDFDNSSYSTTTFGGSGASITNNLESISNYTSNYGSQPSAPSVTLE